MIRTSSTLARMRSMDESTTLRVDAWPTPSVPARRVDAEVRRRGRDDESKHHGLERCRNQIGELDQGEGLP